jgi:polyhydroxyalkanoate synthase
MTDSSQRSPEWPFGDLFLAEGIDALSRIREEAERLGPNHAKMVEVLAHVADTPTGQTPKESVWRRNKATLWRYLPRTEQRHPVPLLIVYALINKPYILDLHPGGSLIEFLLDQGFEVFLLEWGTPGPEDRGLTFDDYVGTYLPRAIAKMLRVTGADAYSLLGYCMGGTIAAIYAALLPESERAKLRNMVLLAAPIDFADAGTYSTWLQPDRFDVDALVDRLGNVPGEFIDLGNRLLKPVTNFVGPYTNLWERISGGKDLTGWLTMNKWVNDAIPFPGEAFRQWIKEMYQENKLTKGELLINGQAVDLRRITSNLLVIAAEKDHIVPCGQATPVIDQVSSDDKELLLIPAGHVSLVVGRGATTKLWPSLSSWLAQRSAEPSPTKEQAA